MSDLLIGLVIFAAGFGAAWSWQGANAEARIGTLTTQHEKQAGDAARQAARNLKVMQDNADRIDAAAAIRTAALDRKLQETKDALKTATRNRPCLGGPALRLLGQSPGLRLGVAGPASAGPLYRGSAGTAADPEDESDTGYATDSQIAAWIATAGVYYERCRGRIRDIREWVNADGQDHGAALISGAN